MNGKEIFKELKKTERRVWLVELFFVILLTIINFILYFRST